MAHFIIGCFAELQQVRHAEEQLLAAGFSRDQLERPVEQTDSPAQSAGEEVSGLQSFVTSIAGEPPPAAIIPDDLTAESAPSVDIRVQVADATEAVQAENILRQAGARTVTKDE